MQDGKNSSYGSNYIIALYIRLSVEDRDVSFRDDKTESNSITNQRTMLYDYVQNHKEFAGCTVIEKCDDGFSGTNFDDRPAFNELIGLAKKGKVNCIIVKDFSRFGRNYVELGDYLEQYFPFLGVRFISVNDNYDSDEFRGTTGGLDVAFKNMIYDFYSREISNKQRLAWRRMAEKGEYNAPCAIYGYKKAPDNIHKLVIHEITGKIVKEIFEFVASGVQPIKVAKMLNERGEPAPSEFHNLEGYTKIWSRYHAKCYWTDERIRMIVADERYTGTMISLKTTSYTIKGKRVLLSPSKWVRVENTHEPIVTYELYQKANSMIKHTASHNTKKKEINLFNCGYCGRKMFKNRDKVMCDQKYFIDGCICSNAVASISKANETIMSVLRQQLQIFIKEAELSKSIVNQMKPCDVNAEISALTNAIATMRKTWMPLYEKYSDGILSREAFLIEKQKYDEDVKKLETQLSELMHTQSEQNAKIDTIRDDISQLEQYVNQMELTEEIKEKFIDKVMVYGNNRIEIYWKYDIDFSNMNAVYKCG